MEIQPIVDEMKRANGRKTFVVYHDECTDGFTAAWAAQLALGQGAKLIPAQHGRFDPTTLEGDYLLIVDFAFKLETLLELQRRFKHVLVLDHHKSHERDLKEFGSAVYDVNRSGAGITWDVMVGGVRPTLIAYVEDRDLWRKQRPGVDLIAGVIESFPRSIQNWDWLRAELDNPEGLSRQMQAGEAIQRFKDRSIEHLIERARTVSIGGYEVPSVNGNRTFASELGNRLAVGHPFAAVWAQTSQGKFAYSLRSALDGVDCAVVAEKFGGGGHKHAAAFVSDKIFD